MGEYLQRKWYMFHQPGNFDHLLLIGNIGETDSELYLEKSMLFSQHQLINLEFQEKITSRTLHFHGKDIMEKTYTAAQIGAIDSFVTKFVNQLRRYCTELKF